MGANASIRTSQNLRIWTASTMLGDAALATGSRRLRCVDLDALLWRRSNLSATWPPNRGIAQSRPLGRGWNIHLTSMLLECLTLRSCSRSGIGMLHVGAMQIKGGTAQGAMRGKPPTAEPRAMHLQCKPGSAAIRMCDFAPQPRGAIISPRCVILEPPSHPGSSSHRGVRVPPSALQRVGL